MPINVTIPEVGESIKEGVLAEWSRADGDLVARDEPLLVLETDKITMNVNAAQAGRLKILVPAGTTVQIELYKGGIFASLISSSAPNTGSYSWTVPALQTVGGDYRIRISSVANPAVFDTSNANFTIELVPEIRISSPNGGEHWKRGSTHELTWVATGPTGSSVKIELYKAGLLDNTISADAPNTGSYLWDIPADQTAGADYRIKVTDTSDPAVSDSSDADVSIGGQAIADFDGDGKTDIAVWRQDTGFWYILRSYDAGVTARRRSG